MPPKDTNRLIILRHIQDNEWLACSVEGLSCVLRFEDRKEEGAEQTRSFEEEIKFWNDCNARLLKQNSDLYLHIRTLGGSQTLVKPYLHPVDSESFKDVPDDLIQSFTNLGSDWKKDLGTSSPRAKGQKPSFGLQRQPAKVLFPSDKKIHK
jgi:hypothetical protein